MFLAGDYRGALTSFKTGYQQTQDPAFLLNIAQCHRSLEESRDALMMFRLYLKSSPEGLNPDARVAAAKAIKELENETKIVPPAKAAAAAPGPAAASAIATPALRAPATEPPLTSSPSAPKFQNQPGGMPVLEPLPELDARKTSEPPPGATSTPSSARSLRIAGIVCGAAGLLSAGAGVYYWTRARSLSDSANTATIYNRSDYDNGKSAEKMQWILYGAGGAAVATGVGLLIYSSLLSPPKTASVSLAPMVGPDTAGLVGGGSF